MKTYIALLRGINVGGHKKIAMAELRELLNKSGLKNVKTYIQSGNVIFQSSEEENCKLKDIITKSILDYFGFGVPVLVWTRSELIEIYNNCPLPEEKKTNSYFAMLTHIPDKELVIEACQKTYENEEYYIIDNCIYFYCAAGYGKAKFNLNYFERKLKVEATARNYKTMIKLLSMSEESDSNI